MLSFFIFSWWDSGCATPKYGSLAYRYLKQKEFEKLQVRERLYDLPLKQVLGPSWEMARTPGRKAHPQPQAEGPRDATWTGLTRAPLGLAWPVPAVPLHLPALHQPGLKPLSLSASRVASLRRPPHHAALTLNLYVWLSPVNPSSSV